jgi:hypothetical protein
MAWINGKRRTLWKALLIFAIPGLCAALPVGKTEDAQSVTMSPLYLTYVARKHGIPFLRASVRMSNGVREDGRALWQIEAQVTSVDLLSLLFRMNNRFTSTLDPESFVPVRYLKEIDQDGLFVQKKRYHQNLTFDHSRNMVRVEQPGTGSARSMSVPPETYDPLSMFARCYLKEKIEADQDIAMSIYDGVKLQRIVFHSRRGKFKSELYGEVDALCLESNTSFSSFGDREGSIRIWFTADGRKMPVAMELDLPVGKVRFDLEQIREG